MTDLYEDLGVARDAPAADIRRAYRRRAKKAHPDGGGSVDEFQRLTRAVEILTDDTRRRKYDETGKVEDAVDNAEAQAMQFLFGQIDFVIGQIQARGLFLDDIDVIGDVRAGLQEKLRQANAKADEARRRQEFAAGVAARFKARKGKTDRIGPMWRARAQQFAGNVEAAARDRGMIERAIEILEEHEFGAGGKTAIRAPNPYQQAQSGPGFFR